MIEHVIATVIIAIVIGILNAIGEDIYRCIRRSLNDSYNRGSYLGRAMLAIALRLLASDPSSARRDSITALRKEAPEELTALRCRHALGSALARCLLLNGKGSVAALGASGNAYIVGLALPMYVTHRYVISSCTPSDLALLQLPIIIGGLSALLLAVTAPAGTTSKASRDTRRLRRFRRHARVIIVSVALYGASYFTPEVAGCPKAPLRAWLVLAIFLFAAWLDGLGVRLTVAGLCVGATTGFFAWLSLASGHTGSVGPVLLVGLAATCKVATAACSRQQMRISDRGASGDGPAAPLAEQVTTR